LPAVFELLEALPDATLIVDRTARIVFANARVATLFGVPRAALEGAGLDGMLAPECRPWLCELIANFLATPPSSEPEARYRRAGDQDLLALRAGTDPFPIELALGRRSGEGAVHAVAVIRDLTAARHAQVLRATEAHETSARLDAMLEFAPAFIIAVSREGRIEYINRIMPQYHKADVIGGSWTQYFPPEHRPGMEIALATVFETGVAQAFESTTAGPDGAARWFSTQLGAVREGDKTVGAVLVAQDITDRKRAQAELVAARHMALLGTLAAGVAHEINTPIQFVGDSIQFLRDSASDLLALIVELQALRASITPGMPADEAIASAVRAEEKADLPYIRQNLPAAFERSIDGLNRVAAIVRSLKDFAHPSEKEMKAVDLNRAIEGALMIARGEYKYVADLVTEFGEIPPVVCHAAEISQAVLNVVVNAAHAIGDVVRGTDHKGRIEVRTRRDGDKVIVSIGDSGGGIPEAIRGRIFDPFFTTKEVGKGTGQGLAIAWATVKEQHGGELRFETEVGKGTTFFIELPIAGKTSTPVTAPGAG
jgi:PAS domain S-box-containing protein